MSLPVQRVGCWIRAYGAQEFYTATFQPPSGAWSAAPSARRLRRCAAALVAFLSRPLFSLSLVGLLGKLHALGGCLKAWFDLVAFVLRSRFNLGSWWFSGRYAAAR